MKYLNHFIMYFGVGVVSEKVSRVKEYTCMQYTAFYGNGELIIYPSNQDNSLVFTVENGSLKEF